MKKNRDLLILGAIIFSFIGLICQMEHNYKSTISNKNNVEEETVVKKEQQTKNDISPDKKIVILLENEQNELASKCKIKENFRYGIKINVGDIEEDSSKFNIIGYFDGISKAKDNIYSAYGWVYSDINLIEYVLLVNKELEVKGIGVYGIKRDGLSEAINKKNADNCGWTAYCENDKPNDIYIALVKIKGEKSYVKLKPEIKVK